MSDSKKLSVAAVVVAGLLSLLALPLYVLQLASLGSLTGSDAAGNGMAQGFAAIAIIALWLLLGIVTLIAIAKGDMPRAAVLAALVLVPVAGFISFDVLQLMLRPSQPPYLWPAIIPTCIPPLVVAYCFWALLPGLRARVLARRASGAVWGLVFILCAAIVPFEILRNVADAQDAAVIEKYEAELAKVLADAPLWDWARFFDTRNATKLEEMLTHIQTLDRRQADAELMLARGDFPLGFMARLDLTPTPALCDNARALLRKRLVALLPAAPQSKSYRDIGGDVSDALAGMTWLIGYECDVSAEAEAWETLANGYPDRNFDAVDLRRLQDPKELALEPSAPLCREALKDIRANLTEVYRPKPDDPRPYGELLGRLGAYRPLDALIWLASRGCDAEPEVTQAEDAIRTYQSSPAAAAMLDRLAQLRKR